MIGQLFSKLHPNYDLMVVNHAFLFNLNTNSFMIITQYLTFSHDILNLFLWSLYILWNLIWRCIFNYNQTNIWPGTLSLLFFLQIAFLTVARMIFHGTTFEFMYVFKHGTFKLGTQEFLFSVVYDFSLL